MCMHCVPNKLLLLIWKRLLVFLFVLENYPWQEDIFLDVQSSLSSTHQTGINSSSFNKCNNPGLDNEISSVKKI